jgi:hypothetical protein
MDRRRLNDLDGETQQITRQQKLVNQMNKVNRAQPPLVYFALGLVTSGAWALGTSVQVLTSEAWMNHTTMNAVSLSAYVQLWDVLTGQPLPGNIPLAPVLFGWGVQMALIVASVGVELPKKPAWRWWLAVGSCSVLIVANSCGDFASSSQYGIWGQLGFSAVVFFLTFVMAIFALLAFRHAFQLAKLHAKQMGQE